MGPGAKRNTALLGQSQKSVSEVRYSCLDAMTHKESIQYKESCILPKPLFIAPLLC